MSMEKPIICENTTVYDFRAHCRFNSLMVGLSQWVMYGVSMLLGMALIVVYCFWWPAPMFLIFGILIVALINLMKFLFQPSSLKKTFQQIYAVRGEMLFLFRFHEDSFDELCRSSKGEMGVEVSYDLLKKIVETKEEILFVTEQNTAFYMRKEPDYEYETNQLSKILSGLKNYRYRGRKPQLAEEPEAPATELPEIERKEPILAEDQPEQKVLEEAEIEESKEP